MTHSERARAWFKRHAYATYAVPGGEVTGYHVTWSEEVERDLAALLDAGASAVLVAPLPDHPPWRNQTNYDPPKGHPDENHGHLP